jgi:hypothetical protein
MAYTPRTWNNEVITDAKLNALENGLAAASKLSGTDIDVNKDWDGRAITNAGVIQNQTGNIGSLGEFVDVAGDTVRKTVAGPGAIPWGSTVVVASLTIPSDYDAGHASAFRIVATCSMIGQGSTVRTITVKRGGTIVGSETAIPATVVDTSASFGPGDTLTVEATSGGAYDDNLSVSQVQICSARSATIPALKVFVETTW